MNYKTNYGTCIVALLFALGCWEFLPGCGQKTEPFSEQHLIGSWTVENTPRGAISYTFQSNHTFTMVVDQKPANLEGIWKLDGNRLTAETKSLSAYGITNQIASVGNLTVLDVTVDRPSQSSMIWRSKSLKMKLRKNSDGNGYPRQ